MSGILDKMMNTIGLSPGETELYNRAFEKASRGSFIEASKSFSDAAKKFSEKSNSMMAEQARANSLLYRYLATKDPNSLSSTLDAMSKLQQIEKIGLETEMMPTGPLRLELECRVIEMVIAQAREDDVIKLRDLHKHASNRFHAIGSYPLITYEYNSSKDGHNGRADERSHYHNGWYQYYEAMTKKDSDPESAAEHLALANLAFRNCNDAPLAQKMTQLLESWRMKRICWICHREVQGYELHFSMYNAKVTPYEKLLLESLGQDISSINLEAMQISVCTPCGSMVTFKAMEEADKVRKELTTRLDSALNRIQALEIRLGALEKRISHS